MTSQNSTSASVFQQNLVSALTNVILNNTASCNAASSISQIIQINSTGDIVLSNVTLSGSSYINSECLAEVENDAELVTEMVAALETEIENKTSQSSGISANFNQSQLEIINQAITEFEANFSMSNVMQCISSQDAIQQIILNNAGSGRNVTLTDISITMDSKVVSNCMLTGSNVASAITDISSTMAAAVSNSTTQGCFGSDTSQLLLILGGIILLVVVLRLVFQQNKQNQ